MSTVYRVGDLRRVIKESATKSEFRPVYGSGVQDDNKKINRQAYKDIEKETKSYDGGLDNKRKNDDTALTPTENKGMSDIMYASAPKPFKERVKSQLNGYVSADAEKSIRRTILETLTLVLTNNCHPLGNTPKTLRKNVMFCVVVA